MEVRHSGILVSRVNDDSVMDGAREVVVSRTKMRFFVTIIFQSVSLKRKEKWEKNSTLTVTIYLRAIPSPWQKKKSNGIFLNDGDYC